MSLYFVLIFHFSSPLPSSALSQLVQLLLFSLLVCSPHLYFPITCTPLLSLFTTSLSKMIRKCTWKDKRSRIGNTILKENKIRDPYSVDFWKCRHASPIEKKESLQQMLLKYEHSHAKYKHIHQPFRKTSSKWFTVLHGNIKQFLWKGTLSPQN